MDPCSVYQPHSLKKMYCQGFVLLFFFLLTGRLVSSYTPPYYIWPLAPEHVDAEIIRQSTAGKHECYESTPGHPSLNYSGLLLPGTANSYLEYTLKHPLVFQDIAVVLYLKPRTTCGTIFHYQGTNPILSQNETDVLLYYNSSSITLVVYNTSDTSQIYVHFTTPNVLTIGTWNSVIMMYELSWKSISLYFEPQSTQVSALLPLKLSIAQEAKFRVGKSFYADYSDIDAAVSCLQFYDGKLKVQDFPGLLPLCLSSNWPTSMSPMSTPSCPTAQAGVYRLIRRNKSPSANIAPIQQYHTSSRIQCADWCSRPNSTCTGFVIKTTQAVCQLYTDDERCSLTFENGADFYML